MSNFEYDKVTLETLEQEFNKGKNMVCDGDNKKVFEEDVCNANNS